MATYSNNSTIKFVTGFQISCSNGSDSYSVPAGHFAILGCSSAFGDAGTGGSASVTVDGVVVLSSAVAGQKNQNGDIHVGEGQSIVVSASNKASNAAAQGAVFKNTP